MLHDFAVIMLATLITVDTGAQGQVVTSIGEAEQRAIQLTKDAHSLAGENVAASVADVGALTNEQQIRQRLSTLKGTLAIVGWSAKRIDDQTFFVTYTFEQDGQARVFPFEANLAAGIVRNVADDPALRRKYAVAEPPELQQFDGKWRDLDGTLMPMWKPPHVCELKSNGDAVTVTCDYLSGKDRTVANGTLSRFGDRIAGRVTVSYLLSAQTVMDVCEVQTDVSLTRSADGNQLNGRIRVVSMLPRNGYICGLMGRTLPADQALTLHRDR